MAKFCGNCGTQLEDSAKICGNCGMPWDSASNITGLKVTDLEKQKKMKKTVNLVVGVVTLVIVTMIAVNVVSQYTGYNGLLHKTMTAYKNYDIDTLISLSSDMYYYGEEDWVEYYFEYNVGEDLDYFESYVGHNYKLSYELQETYTLSSRKLDAMLDTIKSAYPNFDINAISQVKVSDVQVTAKGGESSTSIAVQITMTKENGKWKLLYID